MIEGGLALAVASSLQSGPCVFSLADPAVATLPVVGLGGVCHVSVSPSYCAHDLSYLVAAMSLVFFLFSFLDTS